MALAAKGGVDAVSTRHAYPRVAELPFDAAYKLMATFHRMTDDTGPRWCAASSRARPTSCWRARRRCTTPTSGRGRPTGSSGSGTWPRTRASGERACGCWPPRARTSTRRPSTPTVTCWPRCRTASSCCHWSASSTRPGRPPGRPSPTAEAAGIRVRMITGDHAVTAAAIAGKLGIEGTVMTGAEFAAMDDDEALDADRRHRRDRPRHPRGQGAAGGPAQAQGPHRRHDRRRGQRRTCAQEGRHRHRDGYHRHRGRQGSGRHGADRRQLLHHRQGRRAGAWALRQPGQVHPVPDGLPVRLHRLLPGRGDLQHRRRHPLPAAPDAVDQLHDDAVPGGRPRLRPACRRPDGAPPPRPASSRSCRARRWSGSSSSA